MPELLSHMPLALFGSALNTLVVILGIGLLIFVHEAGHFLVAKWNNVRVEAFSLGFGPVIWGFRRGETHYRLSAIPLGGYVKMAGENPGEGHTDDPREFQNKSVLARASILVAGVVMNAVVAFLLFVFAFHVGVPLPAPIIGGVQPGSPAWNAGFLPGDRVLSVDGTHCLDFEDIAQEIAFAKGPVTVEVERDGKHMTFSGLMPKRDSSAGLQRIGLQWTPERVVQFDQDSPLYRAGMRPGDEILTVAGVDWSHLFEAEDALGRSSGPVPFVVRRDGEVKTFEVTPDRKPAPNGTAIIGIQSIEDQVAAVRRDSPARKAGLKAGDILVAVNGHPALSIEIGRRLAEAAAPAPVTLRVKRNDKEIDLAPVTGIRDAQGWKDFFDGIYRQPSRIDRPEISLAPAAKFPDGVPAAKAGIEEGATILTVNGEKISTFEDIIQKVGSAVEGGEAVTLTWRNPGEEKVSGPVKVTPRVPVVPDFAMSFGPVTEKVKVPGIVAAAAAGLRRSLLTGRRIIQMLGGLFTGRVSAKNLGGPVAIFQISYATAKRDIFHFFYFLGILSVNLAILNVLPIPVLDGGGLLFVLIEAIRRKPLSERAMAGFQWAGLMILMLLMLFVIIQDVGRLIGS